MIVQVSEKIACPVIRVKNNLQCEICFLCEVVDREEYEKTTQKGKIKELEKKIHKLKEEKDNLSRRLDVTAAIASAETRERQKAEETIEEMKVGFRELERMSEICRRRLFCYTEYQIGKGKNTNASFFYI